MADSSWCIFFQKLTPKAPAAKILLIFPLFGTYLHGQFKGKKKSPKHLHYGLRQLKLLLWTLSHATCQINTIRDRIQFCFSWKVCIILIHHQMVHAQISIPLTPFICKALFTLETDRYHLLTENVQ